MPADCMVPDNRDEAFLLWAEGLEGEKGALGQRVEGLGAEKGALEP